MSCAEHSNIDVYGKHGQRGCMACVASEATDSLNSGEGRANTKVPSELARSAPSKKGSSE